MMRVLVSACLLGEKVRYNGADAASGSRILADWVREGRVVPFCPEVAGGLGVPLLGVAVALEQDLLVLLDDRGQDLGEAVEVAGLEPVELVRERLERIRHGGVEHGLRPVDRRGRADRPELELVAGERERRGAVAVTAVHR
jgi:hypothetical protein